jgi:steroid delta-isomerase-like uncharacterized protein
MQVETKVSPEDTLRNFRNAIAAFNRHDLEPYFALLDPNYVSHDPIIPEPMKGRETVRDLNEGYFKSFPDLEFKILNIAASSDLIAAELMMSGTFKGPIKLPQGTIPPTGRHLELTYAAFYQVNSKGLLAEGRAYYDPANALRQLGVKA